MRLCVSQFLLLYKTVVSLYPDSVPLTLYLMTGKSWVSNSHPSGDTRAATLFSILKDVLCHFNLITDNCHGQCYDGVENMRTTLGCKFP